MLAKQSLKKVQGYLKAVTQCEVLKDLDFREGLIYFRFRSIVIKQQSVSF